MSMDEGLPIAYVVLERNVPVYASGGELVGTVDHVVAAREQDIFHGIVIGTGSGGSITRSRDLVPADHLARPADRLANRAHQPAADEA